MAVISEKWVALLEPGLRKLFELQRAALIEQAITPQLFNVSSSSRAKEYDQGIGGMSDWEVYNGSIEYDEPEIGFQTVYEHTEFTRGIQIERKLVDDDQYNVIARRVNWLALTAERKREKDGASVFNNAFSSSYTGGDSVELCGAHPYSPTDSATQDNSGTSALSYDSIIATQKLMRLYEDDRHELMPVQPDTLLVPPALEDTAYYATQAINKAESPAGGFPNYVRSKGFNVVVWPYLTDANNWFMIDSTMANMFLNWFERVPVEFAVDPTGDYNLMARFRGYMRYSYGWSDWRWIYGHEVA